MLTTSSRALLFLVVTGASAISDANAAIAQSDTPAKPASTDPSPSPESTNVPDIVVVAQVSGQSSIDRTTYVVRDNAEARSSSSLDVLAKIPFVNVSRSGEVRLMGNAGVTILVDGKEVADTNATLRNLQGSQIAKIEVSSNPSAAFSARGTAGIINIITRRQFASGVGGSLTASAGSFNDEFKMSPTWSRKNLSLSGGLNFSSLTTPTEFERERVGLGSGGDPATASFEKGSSRTRTDNASGNVLVSYKLGPKQTLSLNLSNVQAEQNLKGSSDFTFDSVDANVSHQSSTVSTKVGAFDASLDYQREGARTGETLTLSSKWSRSRVQAKSLYTADDIGGADDFSLTSDSTYSTATLKADYVRPVGKNKQLSAGISLINARGNLLSSYGGAASNGGTISPTRFVVRGSWLEKSAYLTYQAPALGGTLLVGLRGEGRNYDLTGSPTAKTPGGERFFPSLHLERKFAKQLVADLSYSRRVAWPGITDLNPALRFSDSTTASTGNPGLRPELTDSYEAKIKLGISKQDLELAFFVRRTRDSWTDSTELNSDGVLVKRLTNLGTRTLRGASLSASGPLGGGFRYTLNGNLADQSFDLPLQQILAGTSPQYSGSAEIEFRDGVEGRHGADHIVLSARYNGPTTAVLYRISPMAGADLSWSHAITNRIWSVVKIDDLFGPQPNRTSSYSRSSFARDTYRTPGPSFTLTLTYSLGRQP